MTFAIYLGINLNPHHLECFQSYDVDVIREPLNTECHSNDQEDDGCLLVPVGHFHLRPGNYDILPNLGRLVLEMVKFFIFIY